MELFGFAELRRFAVPFAPPNLLILLETLGSNPTLGKNNVRDKMKRCGCNCGCSFPNIANVSSISKSSLCAQDLCKLLVNCELLEDAYCALRDS